VDKSMADLLEAIISDWKKFCAFMALISLCLSLIVTVVWLVPPLLHVTPSKITISSKGSEIELKASSQDQDQFYLIVSPQTSWQPTHIYVKKGSKLSIVADGRVNVDLYGLVDYVQKRIDLETQIKTQHSGLREDTNHVPEQYFTEKQWHDLESRHYWSGPMGDAVIAPTSYAGRQKYKIAPELSYGALIGTIMTREDLDSDGQPPNEDHDVFLVGNRWPDPNNEQGATATGWLWLAINDVVEPQLAYPNAKKIRVPELFTLDNLGFYRAVVTIPH
jgi:hypothetical protein